MIKILIENTKTNMSSIPWHYYLDRSYIDNKNLQSIFRGESQEFESSNTKRACISAIKEYIKVHERGFEDNNYRDSLYTKDDEEQFIKIGKNVLQIATKIPVKK